MWGNATSGHQVTILVQMAFSKRLFRCAGDEYGVLHVLEVARKWRKEVPREAAMLTQMLNANILNEAHHL